MKKETLLLLKLALVALIGFTLTGSAYGAAAALAVPMVTHTVMAYMPNNILAITLPTLDPKTAVTAVTKFAGQFSKTLLMQTLNGLDVFSQLKVDRNVSRHGKLLPKITVNAGMRPLDTDVDRNKGVERTLGGRKLFVNDCMKIFRFVPEEVIETYMSDMLAPGAKVIPFAQFFWQAEMQKLASEINDNFYLSSFHGDAAAFDASATYADGDYVKYTLDGYNYFYQANAATTAGQSPITTTAKWDLVNSVVCFDGPGTILSAEITDSNITPIVTGALTNTNAYTKTEDMYDVIPVAVRNKGGKIRMSHDVFRKYLKDERAKYSPIAYPGMGNEKKEIYGDGGKWMIEPATWMGGSQRIIFDSQGQNLCAGTNLAGTPGVTKSVETLHGTDNVAKFTLGSQIADLEVLFVNDQA